MDAANKRGGGRGLWYVQENAAWAYGGLGERGNGLPCARGSNVRGADALPSRPMHLCSYTVAPGHAGVSSALSRPSSKVGDGQMWQRTSGTYRPLEVTARACESTLAAVRVQLPMSVEACVAAIGGRANR